jgi:hypothetical protein
MFCTTRDECSQCNDGFFIDHNNRANCGCIPGQFYDGKTCQCMIAVWWISFLGTPLPQKVK